MACFIYTHTHLHTHTSKLRFLIQINNDRYALQWRMGKFIWTTSSVGHVFICPFIFLPRNPLYVTVSLTSFRQPSVVPHAINPLENSISSPPQVGDKALKSFVFFFPHPSKQTVTHFSCVVPPSMKTVSVYARAFTPATQGWAFHRSLFARHIQQVYY